MHFTSAIITQDEYSISKTVPAVKAEEPKGEVSSKHVMQKPVTSVANRQERKSKNLTSGRAKISALEDTAGPSQNYTTKTGKELQKGNESVAGSTILKSSLKTSESKRAMCSVTWADEKTDGGGRNLYECREIEDNKGVLLMSHSADEDMGEESYRFTSAEACARALNEAAEAVASGKSYASEAGIVLFGV